jgi:hypothetical protein
MKGSTTISNEMSLLSLRNFTLILFISFFVRNQYLSLLLWG